MVKTILFYVTDKEDGIKAVKYLIDDIKANDEAQHKLFFRPMMRGTYYISMGTTDDKGNRYMIGDHELLFMPQNSFEFLDGTFKENKTIILQKNCMVIAGETEKASELRNKIINWLLEKTEEVEL